MDNNFDIAVIGAGSAGFSSAIKGAELGKKVVLIENGTIGGTCVNIGCIPSKFIISEAFSGSGWNSIKKGRDSLVRTLRKEKYEDVLDSYGSNITYIHEKAEFIDRKSIRLSGGRVVTADYFVVTTGSSPAFPDIPGIRTIDPLDSKGLLFIDDLPRSLILVGGRFIALELGQAYARLGVKVTVLQRSNHLIPTYDSAISEGIREKFEEQGIEVITGTTLVSAENKGEVKTLVYKSGKGIEEISAERIVFATGRRGNTESLNLDAAGVEADRTGRIVTDRFLRSSNKRVFAAGDAVSSPGLVYVAAKEGQTAVQNMFASSPEALQYDAVPEVIFTRPQIAGVGLAEKEAAEMGIKVVSSKFRISDTPYGQANSDKTGIIILRKNRDTDKLIGGEIMARDAGNMIQTLTVAVEAQMTADDLKNTYFPYLTAVEGIKLGSVVFDKDVNKLSCCAG